MSLIAGTIQLPISLVLPDAVLPSRSTPVEAHHVLLLALEWNSIVLEVVCVLSSRCNDRQQKQGNNSLRVDSSRHRRQHSLRFGETCNRRRFKARFGCDLFESIEMRVQLFLGLGRFDSGTGLEIASRANDERLDEFPHGKSTPLLDRKRIESR